MLFAKRFTSSILIEVESLEKETLQKDQLKSRGCISSDHKGFCRPVPKREQQVGHYRLTVDLTCPVGLPEIARSPLTMLMSSVIASEAVRCAKTHGSGSTTWISETIYADFYVSQALHRTVHTVNFTTHVITPGRRSIERTVVRASSAPPNRRCMQ